MNQRGIEQKADPISGQCLFSFTPFPAGANKIRLQVSPRKATRAKVSSTKLVRRSFVLVRAW